MAADGQDVRGRSSSEFVDDTILEAFVPAASQVNVQELLERWDGEILEDKNTIVPFIEQRQFLLLDEDVPVHVVLRTKLLDEDVLEAYLARLAISLEARAYGTLHVKPGENDKSAPASELLYSGTIPHDEEPTICATEVQPEGQDEPVQYVYIFWELKVPIARPKAKINKLSIYFTPSASLKTVETARPKALEDEYLPSGVPQPTNLLATFTNDPALKGVKPKLLASSIYKVPNTPGVKELQRTLRSGSRRLFRAAPAFLWRLRFTVSPTATDRNATIAALDLEITPFAGSDVLLQDVQLELSTGKVEVLGSPLPMQCQPGDQVTLLYKLWQGKGDELAALGGNLPNLKVTAVGSVLVSPTCIPKIRFNWTTPVDLPSSRPNSRAGVSKEPPKPINPDALPIPEQHLGGDTTTTVTNGMVFSVTGPPKVTVGDTFTWDLFVINRSEHIHRIAIIAMPKRRPWSKHGQRDSLSSIKVGQLEPARDSLADPIVDERMLYTTQRNATQEPTELICLSPDVRIGPLAPGACFMTELKFVALAAGVLSLDALRIVDLGTQDTVDIRDLPDIVAAEGDSGSSSE